MTRFTALTAAALAAATLTAAPALAKSKAVTLPATAFKSADTKLCMTAESVGIKLEKGAPKTMCLTRTDWEAQGVTFNLK
jgi:hypothetical protein